MTEEWITVVEYAARRHISERQARRIVAALPEEDRTPPETRPAKVKWRPATSGNASEMSGDMSEETAVLGAIGADQPRPGADRWQECPAERPASPADVRPDAQYQALAKSLEILQEQLARKDQTIAEQAATIRELTDQQSATARELARLAEQAQLLHRGDQLERAALKQIAPPKRTWFQNLLAAWNDKGIDQ